MNGVVKKPIRVFCNKGCGALFSGDKLKKVVLETGVFGFYLVCPKCGKQYRVYYSNTEDRRLRKMLHGPNLPTEKRSYCLERLHQIAEELNSKYDPKV